MTAPKLQLVLGVRKSNVPRFLVATQSICAGVAAHPALFGGCPVPVSVFQDQVESLDKAQQAVRMKIPGAAAERDLVRDALFTTVETVRVFVQGLCDASPEQALTLAQAARFKIAAVAAHAKPVLGIKAGFHEGSVILSANAALLHRGKRGRFFNWRYTTNGTTWIDAPGTPAARTTITGLPPLTRCGFQVSVTGMLGQGEWSQTVTFLVV